MKANWNRKIMWVRAPTGHLLSPNEASRTKSGLHLSFWLKGSYGNPQTTQAAAKTIGCSPQTDHKASWMKTTPIQLTERNQAGTCWHQRISFADPSKLRMSHIGVTCCYDYHIPPQKPTSHTRLWTDYVTTYIKERPFPTFTPLFFFSLCLPLSPLFVPSKTS